MDLLLLGFQIVFQPETFLLILLGSLIGTVYGSLPGSSVSMGIALMLPFTYNMDPVVGVVFLTAVYCSAMTGGSIPAILFKIPGTPASTVTTFDGYPLVQQGKAGLALGITLMYSAIGGVFSALIMLFLSPQLSSIALTFGPSELFAVAFIGLSVLSGMETDNVLRTVISGLIGLFIATVGMDPIVGVPRFTWGQSSLLGGIEMIPVLIGMFAIAQVLSRTVKPMVMERHAVDPLSGKVKTQFLSLKETLAYKWVLVRGCLIGGIVGVLPGAGATIASFLSYAAEVKVSRHPEKFGKGALEGVIAPETANNAAVGGDMVPLLSLGIPGGNASAVMMSALLIQGIQVGPMLIKTQPQFLYGIFSSMMVTNIVMVFMAIFVARIFSKILNVNYSLIGPIITMLAAVGCYALQNDVGLVLLMAIAGIFGYIFSGFGFSPAALVLGLVLGEICESNLRRAYMIADGNIWRVFGRPITATLLIICISILFYPFLKQQYLRLKHQKA